MIIVQTLAEANEIQNKIRTRKVASGYAVYARGDVVPELPQQSSAVPARVTPRQIRLALSAAGLRDVVEQAVTASDQSVKDWWEYALDIERNNQLIVSMATQLGISSAQLDALFVSAASL